MNSVLQEVYNSVETRIQAACDRSGRVRSDVTLIAVSKTHPAEMIQDYYDIGLRAYGENKVQELADKIKVLPEDISWHMIGHLQRNKVKYIADSVSMIHSVDSVRLAETINSEGAKCGRVIPVLIEVNVAEEDSKFGVTVHEVLPLIEKISTFPNIHIEGLMTIAPYVEDPELNRPIFAKLKNLSVDIKAKNIDNVSMNALSMGMTGDFEVAIEEGATMIRVGTALFGVRDYSKPVNKEAN